MKVVVFGNVPLTSWVIGVLSSRPGWDLLGVVCKATAPDAFAHHGMSLPSASSYCDEFGIPVLDIEAAGELAEQGPVLGISVRYPDLFKQDYYNKFQPGILNLHGGLLPAFRGVNIANHAILEGAKKNGGTLHFIANGVDTGDIVSRHEFEMTDLDTAKSTFDKTLDALKCTFVTFLNTTERDGEVKRVPQQSFIDGGEETKTYRLRDLDRYREIDVSDFASEMADRKIRAFTFLGQKPAYLRVGNKKYWLSESY